MEVEGVVTHVVESAKGIMGWGLEKLRGSELRMGVLGEGLISRGPTS